VNRDNRLKSAGDLMNQNIQSDQSGSNAKQDQKSSDELRRKDQQRDKPKVGEQHETGSTSNSQPGAGPG
jgi:hypothetical protein